MPYKDPNKRKELEKKRRNKQKEELEYLRNRVKELEKLVKYLKNKLGD